MNYFIAIDIGSSFIKAALFDLDHKTIAEHQKFSAPTKLQLADINKFEVPADAYVDQVRKIVDSFTASYQNVRGLVLSTQQHGFIYDDGSDELHYVSWQDQRCINQFQNGQSYLEYLRQIISSDEMKPCGVELKPALAMCNLFALLHENPLATNKGELFTLGSYIYKKLTGHNTAHAQNLTQLGIYQVYEHCYNTTVLQKAGLDQIKLPDIASSDTTVIGEFTSNGQLLKVFPDFGDLQISLLGSGLNPGEALINIATASQVIELTDNFSRGIYETRPYFNNTFIKVMSNQPAGRNINVLIDFTASVIKDISGIKVEPSLIWSKIHELLQKKPIPLLEVDPRFYATGDHASGGSLSQINSGNLNLSSIFLSMFKSMAEFYWNTIRKINDDKEVGAIVCAGGVSWKLPELVELIRKTTGKPCRLSEMEDEALNGMLRASLMCFNSLK